MSGEVTEHTCHFTVCGEGLTGIVRQLYCYENKQMQAMDILENLHGITISQARNICEGKARLEDTHEGLVQYIEEPDRKFIHAYAEHKIWLETHLQEEAEELKTLMKSLQNPLYYDLDQEQSIAIGRKIATFNSNNPRRAEIIAAGIPILDGRYEEPSQFSDAWDKPEPEPDLDDPDQVRSLTKKFQRYNKAMAEAKTIQEFAHTPEFFGFPKEHVIPEPSEETVKIGKWDVPKNLIDRYSLHVVKRIRKSIRNREIPTTIEGTMELYDLEMERQALHDAICKAVGFDHQTDTPSQEQRDFDFAISEYLDKHAGSLFSGDE